MDKPINQPPSSVLNIKSISDKLRSHLLDRALWHLRKSPSFGFAKGYAPAGKWLNRFDIRNHPEFHYQCTFPDSRIPFSPLDLPAADHTLIELESKLDDWSNEIRASYVATISNAHLVHPHFIISPSENFYTNLLFPHSIYSSESDLHSLQHPRYRPANGPGGKSLVLHSTPNLYHFIFETVARLALAQCNGHNPESFDHFISPLPSSSFEKEILHLLRVDTRKFHWIYNKQEQLRFDQLVFSDTTYGISAELCLLIKNALIGLRPSRPSIGLPSKIYLSRGSNTKTRRMLNEKHVIECLQKAGYTVVIPHLFTLAEQRALFENATTIISSHGAALSNLLWCNPGTKVVELRHRNHTRGWWKLYWNIGSVLQLNYQWICCNGHPSDPVGAMAQYSDINVPLDRLTYFL